MAAQQEEQKPVGAEVGLSGLGDQLGVFADVAEWRHTNGNLYRVLCIANEHTERHDKYPVTVVYQGDNGRIWSRPLSDWHRSMTPNPAISGE